MAVHPAPVIVLGRPTPRIGPPVPVHSDLAGLREVASTIGIEFLPWQDTCGRYLEALAADGRHLYREVAIIAARQNGKTEELVPLITKRLRAGRRMMHTAQNRELPREVFGRVAETMLAHYPTELRTKPRFANGQEEIRLVNGGRYRIVAPTRGGARGPSNDDVIIDELREMEGFGFIAAAKPTLTASKDPQIVYFSNMGEVDSVVLNSVRDRAGRDPRLAYLEWSAGPERSSGDHEGWLEANPAIGHFPTMLEYLEGEYVSNQLAGTMAIFETEHLCRSVATMRVRLLDLELWKGRRAEIGPTPRRAAMAISLDPAGHRASAAIAWSRAQGGLGLRLLYDVTGNPIDTDRLGKDLRETARQHGIGPVGFDPLTDAVLAKYFPRTEPITGAKFANATATFVSAVEGSTLSWADAAAVGDDLMWTARKPHDESGSFQAVRAQDDRPITAVNAAIRAVWLASTPMPRVPRARTAVGF